MDMNFDAVAKEIGEVVKLMRITPELIQFIEERKSVWPVFGKKNSHLYRTQLMEMMTTSGLGMEAKAMVYFFMAVIKNVDRVKKAMDMMDDTIKSKAWFSQTRDFFGTKVVQYVTQAEKTKKFPAVNIPSTNPGLDIMFWCLMTKKEERTLENLKTRTTFCQIALNDELQTLAKSGYADYWTNVVKTSKNPDAATLNLPAPAMREDYYKNPANDKYPLLNKNMTVVLRQTNESGYTRADLIRYLDTFN